jgi:hypothetical protein
VPVLLIQIIFFSEKEKGLGQSHCRAKNCPSKNLSVPPLTSSRPHCFLTPPPSPPANFPVVMLTVPYPLMPVPSKHASPWSIVLLAGLFPFQTDRLDMFDLWTDLICTPDSNFGRTSSSPCALGHMPEDAESLPNHPNVLCIHAWA